MPPVSRILPALATVLLLCAGSSRASAQATGVIAGTVVHAGSGTPIVSASITAQGTGRGALSDASGRFRLTGLSGTEVMLETRRVGFRPLTQRATVGSENVRLELVEAAIELNALVVTGTPGAVERRAVGNSVATIAAADELQSSGATSLGNLLNGRAPGVIVTGGTGRAGTGETLNIRGRSTLSLSQQPLLYIDGVRVSNEVGTGPRTQGGNVVSRLNDISPEDIESVEIIKGPAAGTLYGTEAANGVVQIITKKGGGGAPRLTATVLGGTQWFQDAENRMATNYARTTSGEIVSWNAVAAEKARGTPLFRNGNLQTYEVS